MIKTLVALVALCLLFGCESAETKAKHQATLAQIDKSWGERRVCLDKGGVWVWSTESRIYGDCLQPMKE